MHRPLHPDELTEVVDFIDSPVPDHILLHAEIVQISSSRVELSCTTSGGLKVAIRIDLLSDSIIRARLCPERIPSSPTQMLSCDPENLQHSARIERTDSQVRIDTGKLSILLELEQWDLTIIRNSDGRSIFSQSIDQRCFGPLYEVAPTGYDEDGQGRLFGRLAVRIQPPERFYGLGETFTSYTKNGRVYDIFASDSGSVDSSRSYKAMPILLSSAGYALMVHTSYPTRFDMGSDCGGSYSMRIADPLLDYFIICEDSFKGLLGGLSSLVGKSPLLPKWSFGLWLSRCGYRSWEEVFAVVGRMEENGIPFDVVSLDPWWQGDAPWSTLSWDERHFPESEQRMAELKEDHGIRTCLWINPYVPAGTELYEEGVKQGFFLRDESGRIACAPEAFAGKELAVYDLCDPAQWQWFSSLLKGLLCQGAAVFKTDFGEQIPLQALSHDRKSGLELHNLYPLLYNKCAFEAVKEVYGKGITWGRSGYIGSVRYPLCWGGDSYASFSQMRGQLNGLLSSALSGMPFYSHDIGGFDYEPELFRTSSIDSIPIPGQDEQEKRLEGLPEPNAHLYIRWLQFGIFSSHSRLHGKRPHEPWEYGQEALRISRAYIRLRYRLLPYIYAQSVNSCESSLPFIRPMVLEFQEDRNSWDIDSQYLFGSDLMVSPVLEDREQVEIYFPKGTWYDLYTGESFVGPGWQRLDSPLWKIPVFCRQKAIIPLTGSLQKSDARFNDLVLLCTPEALPGQVTICDEAAERDGELIRFTVQIDKDGNTSHDGDDTLSLNVVRLGELGLLEL